MNPFTVERLAQADLLLLLARLLSVPGEDRSRFDIPEETLTELLNRTGLGSQSPGGRAVTEAVEEATALDLRTWQHEYTRLFDGPGPCAMNETVFVRRDKGTILSDLAGFYRAFGWQPVLRGEKHDLMVTELEFTAMLLVLLSRAENESNHEAIETVTKAIRAFGDDHLGEWILLFADRLGLSSGLTLYRRTAEALIATWSHLHVRYEIAAPVTEPYPGSAPAVPDPAASVEEEMTCGLEGV